MSETLATAPAADAPADTAPTTDAGNQAAGTDAAATNGETTAQAGEPASNEAGQKDADGKSEVPAEYTFTAPEGFSPNEETLGELKTAAKEYGLSQEGFEKFAALGIKAVQDAAGAQAAAYAAKNEEWVGAVKADQSLWSGDGLKQDVKQNISAVLDKFGRDDLTAAFNETGAGNHPAVIRLFNQIGADLRRVDAIDLGKPAIEKRTGNGFDDIATRFYGRK